MTSRTHTSTKTAEEIEAYWTPERRARARPRPLEPVPVSVPTAPPPRGEAPRDVPPHDPLAKAVGRADDKKAEGAVGAPAPVRDPNAFPWRTIGKLFFTSDGDDWGGSASVSAPDGLLTVAHNLYDIASRSWSDNLWFYPAYEDGGSAYGAFDFQQCWVMDEYVNGDRAYDVGLVRLRPRGGRVIGDIVGHLGYSINRPPERTWVDVGYPGDLHEGQRMMADEGHYTRMLNNNLTVGKQGTLEGGTSGGPWLLYGDLAMVNGVHSFRRPGQYPGEVFSPYFAAWVGDFIQRHFRRRRARRAAAPSLEPSISPAGAPRGGGPLSRIVGCTYMLAPTAPGSALSFSHPGAAETNRSRGRRSPRNDRRRPPDGRGVAAEPRGASDVRQRAIGFGALFVAAGA